MKQYPDIVTLISAGRTYEGRDILGVKVSYSPANENRTAFIESNIHAREWYGRNVPEVYKQLIFSG